MVVGCCPFNTKQIAHNGWGLTKFALYQIKKIEK